MEDFDRETLFSDDPDMRRRFMRIGLVSYRCENRNLSFNLWNDGDGPFRSPVPTR